MMYCKKENEREVCLTFNKEKLLYDICNYSFVEGELTSEDSGHARHLVADIGEKGNIDRLKAVLSLAYSECVEALYPYASAPIPQGAKFISDIAYDDHSYGDDYLIKMRLPQGFAMNTLQYLSKLIHEYMVCRVLQDWIETTYPASAPKWAEKMERAKSSIQNALLSRFRTIRRRLSPF